MSGLRIAHVISPVKVDKERDLYFQQPITFESMRRARDFSKNDVTFYASCYPEDMEIVPDDFQKTSPLTDEICNYGDFKLYRKLPLFKEILQKVYDESDADWIIQTNADIGLMPHFYSLIKRIIDDEKEAFAINKRIMPENLNEIGDLPIVYSTLGHEHNGHDCFVFKRELFPLFDMGLSSMGIPWSEGPILVSLAAYGKGFMVFKNAFATFHLGDRRIWIGNDYKDYRIHNTNEFASALKRVSSKKPEILEEPTIKYLLEKLRLELTNYVADKYNEDAQFYQAA